jgi:salicylate hydroxylase
MDKVENSMLIVGGGIGGLAAALACAQKGAKPLLLERATQFSEVGAGIQMGPNVTRTLFSWGLEKALNEFTFVPQSLQVRDAVSGQTLGTLTLGQRSLEKYGAPYVTVHRADLHQVLLQKILNDGLAELKLQSQVDSLQEFHDGISVQVRDIQTGQIEAIKSPAMVGADGLWSDTRNYVLTNTPPRVTGLVAYRALLPMRLLPEVLRQQDVMVWVGSRMHAVLYPVRGGEFLNMVVIAPGQLPESLKDWDHDANQQELLEALGVLHPHLKDVLEAVPAWRRWPICDRPPLVSASQMAKGRIALLGDAAHPMRPFLAQGAGMAIEDAAALAVCWAQVDLPLNARWQLYAQMRWARNARVQARSIRNGRIFHMQGPMRWGRDLAMRLMGESLMDVPWLYAGP